MTANHKTNKNVKRRKDKDVYDNEFVQHSIPRSEFQYSWITSSVLESDFRSEFPYGFFTSSNALDDLLVSSALIHLYDTEFLDVPLIPLKNRSGSLYLNMEVDIGASLLSPGSELSSPPYGDKRSFTNAYNLMNNGPYGWPSWKQLRSIDNQVILSQNKTSQYILMDDSTFIEYNKSLIKSRYSDTSTFYYESPFNTNMRSLEHSVEEIIDGRSGILTTHTYVYDYSSDKIFFSNVELSDRLGFNQELSTPYDTLYSQYSNDFEQEINNFYRITYSEVIWPRRVNVGRSIIRIRPNFSFDWREVRNDREVLDVTSAQGKVLTKSSIWPLDSRKITSLDATGKSALDVYDTLSLYTTASTDHSTSDVGQLCGVSQVFFNGDETTLTASALFSNPMPCSSSAGVFFTNDTEFRIPRITGKVPLQDNIAIAHADIKAISKDYSLVPEFRISKHIDKYLNDENGNFLAPLTNLFEVNGAADPDSSDPDFYQVFQTTDLFHDFRKINQEHADIASPTKLKITIDAVMKFTPYEGFYPAERTLEISRIFSQSYGDGIIYSGSLGPALNQASFRSVLAPLFSPGILHNSIRAGIGYATCINDPIYPGDYNFCNAYGSPLSGGDLDKFYSLSAARGTISVQTISYLSDNAVSKIDKLPFNCILEPDKYLSQKYYGDLYMHPSGSLYENLTDAYNFSSTVYKLGSHKPQYKLAVNNFLSETVDFFIENNSLSVLSSEDDQNQNFFNFNLNEVYKMRVYLRSSKVYDEVSFFKLAYEIGLSKFSADIGDLGGIDSSQSILTYTKWAIDNHDPRLITEPTFGTSYRSSFSYDPLRAVPALGAESFFASTANRLNYDGSIFGPPIRKFPSAVVGPNPLKYTTNFGGLRFDHVTPPYMEGYTFIEYVFKPFGLDGLFDPAASGSKRFSMDEVVNNLTASIFRLNESPTEEYIRFKGNYVFTPNSATSSRTLTGSGGTFSSYFTMNNTDTTRIDDAVSLINLVKNKNVEYSPEGTATSIKDDINAGTRWVIQTNWEAPLFDFAPDVSHCPDASSLTTIKEKRDFHYLRTTEAHNDSNVASGTINAVSGIWNDLGSQIIDANDGLFLEVKDVPVQFLDIENNNFGTDNSKSLADAIGFRKIPVRVGEVAKKKVIKEAIVLVPFTDKNGVKNFFKVTQDKLNDPTPSTIKMLAAMDEYVIPPKFNFKLYDGKNSKPFVQPVAMYFFEFDYAFSKEDLSNIWQNVLPNTDAIKKSVVIEQEFLPGELLESITEDIQWLVFKVKKKAVWDYAEKTVTATDDTRFRFDFSSSGHKAKPDYSYNWPYDYFSVIELAKIEASIVIESDKAADDRRNGLKIGKAQTPIENIKKFANKSLKEQADRANQISSPTAAPTVNPDIIAIIEENLQPQLVIKTEPTATETKNLQEAIADKPITTIKKLITKL
jgi:hypothetical protein